MRNKPRPNNEWWGTDIKDELKDCHCLVNNMSLAAVDAILNCMAIFFIIIVVFWNHQRIILVLIVKPRFYKKNIKTHGKHIVIYGRVFFSTHGKLIVILQ